MTDKLPADGLEYTLRLFRQLRSPAKKRFQELIRNNIGKFEYRWNILAEIGLWDEAIHSFIRHQRRSNCYISNVSDRMRSFMEVEGDTDIEVVTNLVLWTASKKFAGSVSRLIRTGRIQLVCDEHDRSVFKKRAGYDIPGVPAVSRIPSGGFPVRHWLMARLA